jgi:hypothetical protein
METVKELKEALIAMRVALKSVLDESIKHEVINGQIGEFYDLTPGTIDLASESDRKALELLLSLGVNASDMPA